MFDSIKDFLSFMFPVFMIIIIVIGLVVGLVSITQYKSCQVYSDMGITVQYDFWTGCMAKHPTFGWIPVDEYFKVLNLNVPK